MLLIELRLFRRFLGADRDNLLGSPPPSGPQRCGALFVCIGLSSFSGSRRVVKSRHYSSSYQVKASSRHPEHTTLVRLGVINTWGCHDYSLCALFRTRGIRERAAFLGLSLAVGHFCISALIPVTKPCKQTACLCDFTTEAYTPSAR